MENAQSGKSVKLKLVSIGDGSAGKTCILLSYTTNKFPEDHVPTIFDNYSTLIQVGDRAVNLDLWDTAGQDEYADMRRLAYLNADIFLITFSVVEPASYDNAIHKWYKELKESNPEAKKIFVGNKIDLRDEYAKKYQEGDKNAPIQFARAQKEISELGCKYVECSAKTQEGLKNVFDQTIKLGLIAKDKAANGGDKKNSSKGDKDKKKDKGDKDKKKEKKEHRCNIF